MQTIAQSWLVYTLTHSAFQLGIVSTFQYLPVMILSLYAGVVVDRVPKRYLIIVTQTIFLILALILGLLTLQRSVQVWEIYFIAALFGIVNAFDLPARQAFFIEMVGREDLQNAIALNSSTFNASRIFGPALGALTIATMGTAFCFIANAVSFAPVVLGLLLITVDGRSVTRVSQPARRQIADGVRYVRQHERIWLIFVIVAVVNVFGIPMYMTLMPIFADQVLHAGVNGLGLLNICVGVGALAGALALAYMKPGTGRTRLLLLASICLGVAMAAFGLSRNLHLSSALLLLVGLAVVSINSAGNAIVQEATPDALRGRVMSFWSFILVGLTPFGTFLAGAFAEQLGANYAVVAGAGVVLIAAIWVNVRAQRHGALREPTGVAHNSPPEILSDTSVAIAQPDTAPLA